MRCTWLFLGNWRVSSWPNYRTLEFCSRCSISFLHTTMSRVFGSWPKRIQPLSQVETFKDRLSAIILAILIHLKKTFYYSIFVIITFKTLCWILKLYPTDNYWCSCLISRSSNGWNEPWYLSLHYESSASCVNRRTLARPNAWGTHQAPQCPSTSGTDQWKLWI